MWQRTLRNEYEAQGRDNYWTGRAFIYRHRRDLCFTNILRNSIKNTPTPKASKTRYERLLASKVFHSVDRKLWHFLLNYDPVVDGGVNRQMSGVRECGRCMFWMSHCGMDFKVLIIVVNKKLSCSKFHYCLNFIIRRENITNSPEKTRIIFLLIN